MAKNWFLMLLLFILMVGGCSQSSKKEEDSSPSTSQEPDVERSEEVSQEAKEIKTDDYQKYATEDSEEMVRLEPGPYSGNNYDEKAVKQLIDQFPEGEERLDYYSRIAALIAEDYRPFMEFFEGFDTSFDGPTEQPDGKSSQMEVPEEKQINVQILFDASGSMRAPIDGTEKMKMAKDAVKSFLDELPEEVNVSLRAYGHEGTGSDEDKERSCSSIEEVYPFAPYDKQDFLKALDQFSPAGWTPLAAAIESSKSDLEKHSGENVENIIYVVSDGVETCDGDPVKAAKELTESNIQAVINIIGFDVDDQGQKALKKVAEAGKGEYATVRSQQEFKKFFEQENHALRSQWLEWRNENTSHYMKSQNERVEALLQKEIEMKKLTRQEEERFRELLPYAYEKFLGSTNKSSLNSSIRGRALRQYVTSIALPLRDELREKGYQNREEVRDKAREEREKLKNEED